MSTAGKRLPGHDDECAQSKGSYALGCFTPTWLSFNGLPGCGKTTLIERLIPALDFDGWGQIILLPENVCDSATLCNFYRDPRRYAFKLQSDAIERYCSTIRECGKEIRRKNEKSAPYIVIEHTSIDSIFFFTCSYKKQGFIESEGFKCLMVKLENAKMRRDEMCSKLRHIEVCYEGLESNVMIRNITQREKEREKKNRIPYTDDILRCTLKEVNFARSIALYCRPWNEMNNVVRVPYVQNHQPLLAVKESLRTCGASDKKKKRKTDTARKEHVCEIIRYN